MPDTITDALIRRSQRRQYVGAPRGVRETGQAVGHAGGAGELPLFEVAAGRLRLPHELILHDAYISLPGPRALRGRQRQTPCITHSFSRPSPAGGTRALVVYAGRGTAADFAAPRCAGKNRCWSTASPRRRASLRATEAGAVGQIHISPHEHPHEMCISPVWGSPTPETVGRLPRTVVLSVARPTVTR